MEKKKVSEYNEIRTRWYVFLLTIGMYIFFGLPIGMVLYSLLSLAGFSSYILFSIAPGICGIISAGPVIMLNTTLLKNGKINRKAVIVINVIVIFIYSLLLFLPIINWSYFIN